MRGGATIAISGYSATKVKVSHKSCDGKVCLSNGGN